MHRTYPSGKLPLSHLPAHILLQSQTCHHVLSSGVIGHFRPVSKIAYMDWADKENCGENPVVAIHKGGK